MSRVVVTGRVSQSAVDSLADEHEVVLHNEEEAISRDRLLEMVKGADALVTLLTESVDAELLDAAGPQLRVVANVAVGYNNVDVDACRERDVLVTNTPGVLTDATADTAFGLLLMVSRRLGEGDRIIRSGTPWKWGMFYLLGQGLQGKTIGIVGLGEIGAAMARRARAFGMEVAYHSRRPCAPELAEELAASRMDLEDLLRTADVVSLHCPYSEATHHLIGAQQLALMKDSAYLVNSARGPIVDEDALVRALREGTIAGAGLDVFEDEPRVHEGLLELENVALAPHLGSATVETRTAMAQLAADNVLAVLRGEAARTPVG